MSDDADSGQGEEEVQTEQPDQAKAEADASSNQEAMKARFKLIEGEEVLLTKAPSPLGFMSMYMLGLIRLFGSHGLLETRFTSQR